MIHVGQQSTFPKLKFIANRAKLERLIQQGRRQYRPRGSREGDMVNVLSEDDLQGLLKRTKGSVASDEAAYPLSGSESSSSAAAAETPIALPLGFNFTRKKKNKGVLAEVDTNTSKQEAPDSPSLSKRITGWWSKSPRTSQPATPKGPSRSMSPYTHHERPNSMFELRLPKDVADLQAKGTERPLHRNSDFIEDIRRRSAVFVEDEESDDCGFEKVSRRAQQHQGGTVADVDGVAEDAAADFGDDEADGEGECEEVQNAGVGLGLGLDVNT
jgi:hypothetical protein